MSSIVNKIREVLHVSPYGGAASPDGSVVYETADLALADVWKLYERDPTCRSSVDLLAASVVKRFYTTCAPAKDYADAEKAKAAVDEFNEDVNLDGLLHDMAIRLVACGNDFWLRLSPEKLVEFVRLPLDAVERVNLSSVPGFKIPHHVNSYTLRTAYATAEGRELTPEAVLHWSINANYNMSFGVGLLQVLLHTLTLGSNKRPSYAWMKSKIEKILPKIFERYAGSDVLANVPGANEATIKKFETAIKNRGEEGTWLFYNAKNKDLAPTVVPVQIDPRARFEYYIDHIVNQFYLGCETPLPRLFSTPGFTEASARAALELQDMLVDPMQRMVKRRVEREIFAAVVEQAGYDPGQAAVRLNWGSPETPELTAADLISAAVSVPPLIRAEEFRKNAVKILGWELWEQEAEPSASQGG